MVGSSLRPSMVGLEFARVWLILKRDPILPFVSSPPALPTFLPLDTPTSGLHFPSLNCPFFSALLPLSFIEPATPSLRASYSVKQPTPECLVRLPSWSVVRNHRPPSAAPHLTPLRSAPVAPAPRLATDQFLLAWTSRPALQTEVRQPPYCTGLVTPPSTQSPPLGSQ